MIIIKIQTDRVRRVSMTLWRELPHPRLRNGKNKRSINKGKNLMVKLEIGVYSYIKFFIIFSFVILICSLF